MSGKSPSAMDMITGYRGDDSQRDEVIDAFGEEKGEPLDLKKGRASEDSQQIAKNQRPKHGSTSAETLGDQQLRLLRESVAAERDKLYNSSRSMTEFENEEKRKNIWYMKLDSRKISLDAIYKLLFDPQYSNVDEMTRDQLEEYYEYLNKYNDYVTNGEIKIGAFENKTGYGSQDNTPTYKYKDYEPSMSPLRLPEQISGHFTDFDGSVSKLQTCIDVDERTSMVGTEATPSTLVGIELDKHNATIISEAETSLAKNTFSDKLVDNLTKTDAVGWVDNSIIGMRSGEKGFALIIYVIHNGDPFSDFIIKTQGHLGSLVLLGNNGVQYLGNEGKVSISKSQHKSVALLRAFLNYYDEKLSPFYILNELTKTLFKKKNTKNKETLSSFDEKINHLKREFGRNELPYVNSLKTRIHLLDDANQQMFKLVHDMIWTALDYGVFLRELSQKESSLDEKAVKIITTAYKFLSELHRILKITAILLKEMCDFTILTGSDKTSKFVTFGLSHDGHAASQSRHVTPIYVSLSIEYTLSGVNQVKTVSLVEGPYINSMLLTFALHRVEVYDYLTRNASKYGDINAEIENIFGSLFEIMKISDKSENYFLKYDATFEPNANIVIDKLMQNRGQLFAFFDDANEYVLSNRTSYRLCSLNFMTLIMKLGELFLLRVKAYNPINLLKYQYDGEGHDLKGGHIFRLIACNDVAFMTLINALCVFFDIDVLLHSHDMVNLISLLAAQFTQGNVDESVGKCLDALKHVPTELNYNELFGIFMEIKDNKELDVYNSMIEKYVHDLTPAEEKTQQNLDLLSVFEQNNAFNILKYVAFPSKMIKTFFIAKYIAVVSIFTSAEIHQKIARTFGKISQFFQVRSPNQDCIAHFGGRNVFESSHDLTKRSAKNDAFVMSGKTSEGEIFTEKVVTMFTNMNIYTAVECPIVMGIDLVLPGCGYVEIQAEGQNNIDSAGGLGTLSNKIDKSLVTHYPFSVRDTVVGITAPFTSDKINEIIKTNLRFKETFFSGEFVSLTNFIKSPTFPKIDKARVDRLFRNFIEMLEIRHEDEESNAKDISTSAILSKINIYISKSIYSLNDFLSVVSNKRPNPHDYFLNVIEILLLEFTRIQTETDYDVHLINLKITEIKTIIDHVFVNYKSPVSYSFSNRQIGALFNNNPFKGGSVAPQETINFNEKTGFGETIMTGDSLKEFTTTDKLDKPLINPNPSTDFINSEPKLSSDEKKHEAEIENDLSFGEMIIVNGVKCVSSEYGFYIDINEDGKLVAVPIKTEEQLAEVQERFKALHPDTHIGGKGRRANRDAIKLKKTKKRAPSTPLKRVTKNKNKNKKNNNNKSGNNKKKSEKKKKNKKNHHNDRKKTRR